MTEQAQLIEIESGGLLLTGEVLHAERWEPRLAEPPASAETFFRIVILPGPLEEPLPPIEDPLVAVVGAPTTTDTLRLRERPEVYQTSAAPTAPPLVASRYGLQLRPEDVADLTPDGGLTRLAQALVSSTPVTPVFRRADLPRPLRSRDVPLIFDGLFSPRPSLRAQHTLASFGHALGLTSAAQPLTRSAGRSAGVRRIRRLLEEYQGYLEFDRLWQEMRIRHGLPQPLALLYALVFLATGRPDTELHLHRDHGLRRRRGGMWQGDRLHGAHLREIRWPANLRQAIRALAFGEHRLWHVALDWSQRVLPLLKPRASLDDLPQEKQALKERLSELGRTVVQARRTLELELGTGHSSAAAEQTALLERLEALSRAEPPAGFYAAVRRHYPDPLSLDQDLEALRRLSEFAERLPEALAMRSYLNAARLRASDLELDVDRISVLEQLKGDHLLGNAQQWANIRSSFDWFRSRYQALYREHHRDYWRRAEELRHRLARKEGEVQGLARLNSIAELGPPVGLHLDQEYQELLARLEPCERFRETEPETRTEPVCSHCQLPLNEEVPELAVARFEETLETSLHQQRRRLSSEAIRRVLSRSQQPAIDRLLQVLRASEVRPLVAVIDDQVVAFLRELLAEAQQESIPRPVLARLTAAFPTLTEGEVEQVVDEFRRLLEDAFADLRRQHPGKRLRLDLEEGRD